MIDPNTRTDYNKMKKLIQLDRLDGNRKGVIKRIAEEGKIMTNSQLNILGSDFRLWRAKQ